MFEYGSEWRRLDVHLHTVKDKEFKYQGDKNQFINSYVEKLNECNIGVGVITNHNKFDRCEFIGLKKKATKSEILLFPGVELSVKEGSNGIHVLIIFNGEEWIENKDKDSINTFLDNVFKGVSNRENANTRCNKDLFGVIEELNSFKKDYFICLAHVDQRSGLFKECDNGMIQTIWNKQDVRKNVLGLQKAHNRDNFSSFSRNTGCEIACVEGSDCKSIDDIGKCDKVYIKIGSADYNSLLLAFKDYKNRMKKKYEPQTRGYISSISFKGGCFDGETINCSKGLNTLIGIRGSGKSALIECIRYALNIEISENDKEYKNELIKYILGSGGEIELNIFSRFNKKYTVSRICGETPVIKEKGNCISILPKHILKNPLYFGQKDLSNTKKGYEMMLLNKILGRNSSDETFIKVNSELKNLFREYIQIKEKTGKKEELEKELTGLKNNIKIYDEYGIKEKLARQVKFKKDKTSVEKLIKDVNSLSEELRGVYKKYSVKYSSIACEEKQNTECFDALNDCLKTIRAKVQELDEIIEVICKEGKSIKEIRNKLEEKYSALSEEFAKIKRNITTEDNSLKPELYIEWIDKRSKAKNELIEISKGISRMVEIRNEILKKKDERNQLLKNRFEKYKIKIDEINERNTSLKLTIEYKGGKDLFSEELKENVRGTGITKSKIFELTKKFSDFLDMEIDILLEGGKRFDTILNETQKVKLREKIKNDYEKWIDEEVQDKIEILYHEKLLEKHSAGQRASALLLFILSQTDNEVVIIDQPEDDLDNQIIYNEIIKELKQRKENIQFIFATHNPNIPVLGDSEQIISLDFSDEKVKVNQGSIDNANMERKIIEIMEGGKEAFNKRNEIYRLWQE